MGNKRLFHLMELLKVCDRIQHDLLTKERSMQHDYIIVNMYDLVCRHPHITVSQLLAIYNTLLATNWRVTSIDIPLDETNIFTARSLCCT